MKRLCDQMIEIIKSDEVGKGINIVSDGAIAIVGSMDPNMAVILEIVKKSSVLVDDFKIKLLIRQLGENLNMETLKNRLANYIINDDKKAMQIVDIFRKSLLSESIIAITIMGLILGENINENKNMSMDDLIISKALENATDNDLTIFYRLIDSQKIKNEMDMTSEEILTCKWCVYNRIFQDHVMEYNVKERYTNTEVADKLFSYIQEVPPYITK